MGRRNLKAKTKKVFCLPLGILLKKRISISPEDAKEDAKEDTKEDAWEYCKPTSHQGVSSEGTLGCKSPTIRLITTEIVFLNMSPFIGMYNKLRDEESRMRGKQ